MTPEAHVHDLHCKTNETACCSCWACLTVKLPVKKEGGDGTQPKALIAEPAGNVCLSMAANTSAPMIHQS